MSNDETKTILDSMSAALQAATRLTAAAAEEQPAKLTPDMLAAAIKLAALSTEHQEKLTPANVNAAIKLSQRSNSDEENEEQREEQLTTESLAAALKLATRASTTVEHHEEDVSANDLLAAMKAAIAMTQHDQSQGLATADILSDALKLAKQ